MAEAPLTFTKQDLQYYYQNVDGGKSGDIDRITRNLGPGPWTLEQLQQGANLSGLSDRSQNAWNSVLGRANQDVQSYQPPPPQAGNQPPTGGGPPPITMPPGYNYPSGYQDVINSGQASGYTWNPYKNSGQGGWDLTTGNPQLTYWGPTNEYFYQGVPVSNDQVNQLLGSGPYTGPN